MNDHPRKKRKLGTYIVGAIALILVAVAGFAAFSFTNDNGPKPFALTAAPGSASFKDGAWKLKDGEAGYRAQEKAFGLGHEVVGRTTAMSGEATMSAGGLQSAQISVKLDSFTVNGKPHAASSQVLGADKNPTAQFLVESATPLPGDGSSVDVPGTLTLNGVTKPVTLSMTVAASSESSAQAVGHTTVDVTAWNVTPPSEAGMFSIDKSVTIEFTSNWQG